MEGSPKQEGFQSLNEYLSLSFMCNFFTLDTLTITAPLSSSKQKHIILHIEQQS